MRLPDLSRYTRRAIDLTAHRVEDRDTTSPTWDGRTLHVARLTREDHVLHEVAHWLVAPAHLRTAPNYGCGTDPDTGGPQVDVLAGAGDLDAYDLAHMTPAAAAQALAREVDSRNRIATIYERHASLVTVVLMRQAGLPWLDAARKHWLRDADTVLLAWETVSTLQAFGVDVQQPLQPFMGPR